jgi:hypothetical protein
MRTILFVALLLGLIGTALELVLLGHVESRSQLIPLGLIFVGLAALAWYRMVGGAVATRAFQAVMILFMIAGAVGVGLHYDSNVEFEKEMYPTIEGMELFRQAAAGAIPALAPGVMIQLGLVGLAYTQLPNPKIGEAP